MVVASAPPPSGRRATVSSSIHGATRRRPLSGLRWPARTLSDEEAGAHDLGAADASWSGPPWRRRIERREADGRTVSAQIGHGLEVAGHLIAATEDHQLVRHQRPASHHVGHEAGSVAGPGGDDDRLGLPGQGRAVGNVEAGCQSGALASGGVDDRCGDAADGGRHPFADVQVEGDVVLADRGGRRPHDPQRGAIPATPIGRNGECPSGHHGSVPGQLQFDGELGTHLRPRRRRRRGSRRPRASVRARAGSTRRRARRPTGRPTR